MRAAIYARYSSENQNERSIDDQVRLCRAYAEKLGAEVVGVYADYAISGSSLKNRPEANRLLNDARNRAFEIVIAEALDRLSRDQEDVAGIHKRLRFQGVSLNTVAEGEVNELHVGLKGTMNALFVRDLAAKIRRGQHGRVAAGFVPGGLSYGYDIVRELDAKGEPIRGMRRVNETQAAVIRGIFEYYARGRAPRTIAADLNRDKIPSPSGKEWNASTINGNRARRNGILFNEAYVGMIVHNRTTFAKDPDTGRRVSRPNPPEQWVVSPAPHLRIVSDELWDAVQARKAAYEGLAVHRTRRPRHLFSGLIRCGVCGAGYTVKSKDQLACAAHREKGTCSNGRTIRAPDLERRVLDGIRSRLLSPDAVATFVREYHAERKRLGAASVRRRDQIAQQLAGIDKQIGHLVDTIAEGLASPALKEKLRGLEASRAALVTEQETIGNAADTVVDLHPAAVDAYRKTVADLQAGLAGTDPAAREEAMGILRSLVSVIEVHPAEGRGKTEIRIHGMIAELINLAQRRPGEAIRTVMVVAGEGFEPPTLGL